MFCENCGNKRSSETCENCGYKKDSSNQTIIIEKEKSSSGISFTGMLQALGFLILFSFAAAVGWQFYKDYQEKNQSLLTVDVKKDGTISGEFNPNIPVYEAPPQTTMPAAPPQNTTPPENHTSERPPRTFCKVVNNGQTVNYRADCNSKNCDYDSTTIAGSLPDGAEVEFLGGRINSVNNWNWMEVEIKGGIFYIASSKLNC